MRESFRIMTLDYDCVDKKVGIGCFISNGNVVKIKKYEREVSIFDMSNSNENFKLKLHNIIDDYDVDCIAIDTRGTGIYLYDMLKNTGEFDYVDIYKFSLTNEDFTKVLELAKEHNVKNYVKFFNEDEMDYIYKVLDVLLNTDYNSNINDKTLYTTSDLKNYRDVIDGIALTLKSVDFLNKKYGFIKQDISLDKLKQNYTNIINSLGTKYDNDYLTKLKCAKSVLELINIHESNKSSKSLYDEVSKVNYTLQDISEIVKTEAPKAIADYLKK